MKRMKTTLAAAALGLATIVAPATLAQDTIVSYATFPYNPNELGERVSITGTTALVGVSSIDMTRNGGLIDTPTFNAFNSSGWATNLAGETTVVNNSAFVEIGFSLDLDFTATLDSLIIGSDSSGSGPSQVGVFVSTDGFTTPIAQLSQDGGFQNDIIDLSSIGEVSGEFKIRFFNTGGATTADANRIGDMDEESTWRIVDYRDPVTQVFSQTQITGEVVPEPSSLALLGLGGLLIARRRRA